MKLSDILQAVGAQQAPGVTVPGGGADQCAMDPIVGCMKCGAAPGTPCPLMAGPATPSQVLSQQLLQLLVGDQTLQPPLPPQGPDNGMATAQ